jgi:hypothetical protein
MMTGHIEQVIEGPDGTPQTVLVHVGESPLSWLHARGHLSARHFAAGDLLRRDWERAGLSSRVTMAWDGAPRERGRRSAASPGEVGTARIAARERFDGAIRAAGPGLADILWRVVCAGEGLAAAEKALGWPTRAGKLVLTLALDRVAGWYRVA